MYVYVLFMSLVKEALGKTLRRNMGSSQWLRVFSSNIVVQAVVLKVLEKLRKLLGKTPVLESLPVFS